MPYDTPMLGLELFWVSVLVGIPNSDWPGVYFRAVTLLSTGKYDHLILSVLGGETWETRPVLVNTPLGQCGRCLAGL